MWTTEVCGKIITRIPHPGRGETRGIITDYRYIERMYSRVQQST